jgi:putative nucleotidyltransferase with HDIG domain
MFKKLSKIDIRKNPTLRILIALSTIILIAFFFPAGESIEFEVKVGDVWNAKDLIAPFTFPVLKDKNEYEKEIEEAIKSVYLVFEINDTIENTLIHKIDSLNILLVKDFHRTIRNDDKKLDSLFNKYSDLLTRDELNLLNQHSGSNKIDLIFNEVRKAVRIVYKIGLLDVPKQEIIRDSITIRSKNVERVFSKAKFLDISDVETLLTDVSKALSDFTGEEITFTLKLAESFITPNIIFNSEFTNQNIELSKSKVSRNVDIVAENEKIVAKHDRITPQVKRKIDSYKILKLQKAGSLNIYAQSLGKIGHIAMILALLAIYIYLFRKKISNDNSRILLISIIIILISFLAFLSNKIEVDAPIQYLILIPVASMLLTIIFDSRVGFYGTVVISMIIAGIRGNDYTIAVVNLVAGALAAYSVRDIRSRSQIFRSMMFIFTGYLAGIVSLGLERFIEWEVLGSEIIFALVNSAFSPVLTYGLLIFFERTFKVTTDLTLVELLDFNHPLLQTLQARAPGTYHHSLAISTLAESAAKAIGANPVLARVGAMYHDIGKSVEPNYFVENTTDEKSEHDELDPVKSADIIIKHVEEGIELAKKYLLPIEVIDFITEHHGTTTAQYFLTLAKKTQKKVNEDLFRYPGPKPQRKETGIVMLADAVESVSRTLEEPNREELEEIIDKIIRTRFTERQLDECDLTMKDLTKIKESFLNTLCGFYHQRIDYPSEQKN